MQNRIRHHKRHVVAACGAPMQIYPYFQCVSELTTVRRTSGSLGIDRLN